MKNLEIVATKKKSEAQFAYCATCNQWFGNEPVPWSLSKSVALHKRGTGHDAIFYKVV